MNEKSPLESVAEVAVCGPLTVTETAGIAKPSTVIRPLIVCKLRSTMNDAFWSESRPLKVILCGVNE